MTNARSIHIGLNYVDPDAYNGWDGELAGCINDATDMQAIADSLGYSSTKLIDSEATSCRVISELGQAADELQGGDILLVSYSGHGSQVDDVNGEEDDVYDETWCLWDRELVDDELYCLWGRFSPGVRIVLLSDSCHSGTVARMMKTVEHMTAEMSRTRAVPSAEQKAAVDALSRSLGLDPKEFGSTSPKRGRKAATKTLARRTRSAARPAPTSKVGVARVMPPDVQDMVNRTHRDVYAAAQYIAGPSERAAVSATVILISGCQDDQLSSDGTSNGLFTEKLKDAWNDGAFVGDYREFWTTIKDSMPAKQQPNYYVVGAENPDFEAQSPFEIGDGSTMPVTPVDEDTEEPSGPTSDDDETPTSGERTELQEGDSGPAVEELQQMLKDLNYYNYSVDGSFDAVTAGCVRSFQEAYGIEPSGVVDAETWSMLDTAIQELEPA